MAHRWCGWWCRMTSVDLHRVDLPDLSRTALLVVDVQRAFDDAEYWGPRDNPVCEDNVAALLGAWRAAGRLVVFVRHDSTDPASPLYPGQPGNAFKPVVTGRPDLLVTKTVNSCFHGIPDLHAWLLARELDGVVVCGITTNHCCETTAGSAATSGIGCCSRWTPPTPSTGRARTARSFPPSSSPGSPRRTCTGSSPRSSAPRTSWPAEPLPRAGATGREPIALTTPTTSGYARSSPKPRPSRGRRLPDAALGHEKVTIAGRPSGVTGVPTTRQGL